MNTTRGELRVKSLFAQLFRNEHSPFHGYVEQLAVQGALSLMSERDAQDALQRADYSAETCLRFRMGEL